MKVLQINSVYNTGSTGKIVRDLHSILKERNIDSLVIYGRGKDVWKEADDPAVIRLCPEFYAKANTVRSMFTGIPYGGCELSTYRLIRLIERWKPDVVHLQCINEHFLNIYTLLQWLGKNRVPTVITLHAEFLYTTGVDALIVQDLGLAGLIHSRLPDFPLHLSTQATVHDWRSVKAAVDQLVEDLLKAGLIELENEFEQRYRVTSAFHFLEDLVEMLTITEEEENETVK